MQWTKVRTTRLGTSLQKRGRWHGLPFVIRLVAMIILEELIP
jgi:hypothetical protein